MECRRGVVAIRVRRVRFSWLLEDAKSAFLVTSAKELFDLGEGVSSCLVVGDMWGYGTFLWIDKDIDDGWIGRVEC